jgi:hypothetical protein
LHALGAARASLCSRHPALQIRQIVDRHPRPIVDPAPAPIGDVRDREIRREPLVISQMSVEDALQSSDLVLVAGDGTRQSLRKVAEKYVRLALHRSLAAHLEHQLLDHARAGFELGRQEATGFLGKIDHDGPGLEHCEIADVMVDNGWDLCIGVQL